MTRSFPNPAPDLPCAFASTLETTHQFELKVCCVILELCTIRTLLCKVHQQLHVACTRHMDTLQYCKQREPAENFARAT